MIHTQPAFQGLIGVAQGDITPPIGIPARNWGAALHEVAEGIHQPLTLTCLTLQAKHGDQPLVLIGADLGWWKSGEAEWLVRGAVLAALSLDPARLMFCLSHTHAGPNLSPQDAKKPGGGHGYNPACRYLFAVCSLVLWIVAQMATHRQLGVFDLIQNVGAWVAAPVAAVFLLGVLWRRATATAATTVLIFGFPYTWFVESVLFKRVSWLMPFDNWLNRTFVVWSTSMVLMVAVSLLGAPPDPERIKGIIWSWKTAALPESERERNRGLRNLFLWWAVFVGLMLALYGYIFWFQFLGPGAKTLPLHLP